MQNPTFASETRKQTHTVLAGPGVTVAGSTPTVGPFTIYSSVFSTGDPSIVIGLQLLDAASNGLYLYFNLANFVGYTGGNICSSANACGINNNLISYVNVVDPGTWQLTSGSLTQVSATPLPAALPLFASGLAAAGFIGWRRKRKAATQST